MPITVSGTSITFNDATVQTTAGQPGTVTSVATGNGLSGGTITTSGTLSIAAPGFNTVGSYCSVVTGYSSGSYTYVAGSDYSTGNSNGQLNSGDTTQGTPNKTSQISGTWRWMSGNRYVDGCSPTIPGLGVRVS